MKTKEIVNRDNEIFDTTNEAHLAYISSKYGNRRTVVAAFLKDKCQSNGIQPSEFLEVYEIVELKLGYPIPAHRHAS